MSHEITPQGMTLYSHSDDFRSHWMRFMLQEKQISYQLIICDYDDEDFQDLSPYQTLPVLIDHHLKLYHCLSLAEYIDERYQQAKLFAESPAQRAEQRQYLWRFEHDWFHLVDEIMRHQDNLNFQQQQQALQELNHTLSSIAPLFQHFQYFLSNQFSILDCMLAPILLRLDAMNINLPMPHCKAIRYYSQRIYQRESFLQSLTLQEKYRYQSYLK